MRFHKILQLTFVGVLLSIVWGSSAHKGPASAVIDLPEVSVSYVAAIDSPEVNLPYPINDPVNPYGENGRINLTDPANVNNVIEYDPATGLYYFYSSIGDQIDFKNPTVMTYDEYLDYNLRNSIQNNWRNIKADDAFASDEDSGPTPFAPSLKINSEAFDRIFGGNTVDIRPQGSAELIFGVNINKNNNPQIPERQRSITTFNFDQRIQLNVVGNIGEKLKISTNYNTEATFDFENQTKIEYTGYEDEIIQKIEAGNVSLPLSSSLITGSQSLFGFKTQLKFGRLTATTIFSQERSQRKEIDVQGGAQQQEFEISADNYEANRHFFLSGFFRDQYDNALQSLPNVNSGVNITRIEVWAVNQRANVENTRNIIAFTDIGEDQVYQNEDNPLSLGDNPLNRFPDNEQNSLYQQMNNLAQVRGFSNASQDLNALGLQSGRDFEKLSNARKLDPNEFTYNAKLGFISLNQALNNAEVLAVAYEYTLNGQTFQVGDLSNDGFVSPNALYVKLLKSTVVDVQNPLWDLMMKNIYSLGAFQVNREDFILNIWYNDPSEGIDIPFIPQESLQEVPLIQVFALDKLDQNGAARPDGQFDFVDNAATQGGTINSQNGRIFFPVVEPFGSHLDEQLQQAGISEEVRSQIVYQPLYDSTKVVAQQNFLPLNRFKIKGIYKSASSDEIYLNALNIPQGAVKVTAGGVALVENRDFTVDYNLGRVKILNTGLLESQTPIKISVESNTLFSIQTKTLLGGRFDYKFSDKLNIGATILNLYERPLTQKVNIGDEPMSNTLWGADVNYRTESRLITEIIDALPGIETKEESMIDVSAEFAHLIPGHSKAIGKDGNSYLDDFEGAVSTIDLRNFIAWSLGSIPQSQLSLWPEANQLDDLSLGYNRARLSWYIIDPLFFRNDNITPNNINPTRHYQREVLESEVFPNRELPAGTPTNIATFDIAYYPQERGQYNFDAEPTEFSAGINPETGALNDPASRWGSVMRSITTTDFEQTNVEYVQFWVMDPYNDDSREFIGTQGNVNGSLYLHLGNVSEDVLRDGQMSFENGLPVDPNNPMGLETTETEWARVPLTQSIVNAFDNTTDSNASQDVGLDGFNDDGERSFYSDFLNRIASLPGVNDQVLSNVNSDPSADNFDYFRNSEYDALALDITERYKRFNGMDGNSVSSSDSDESYNTQGSNLPSTEDINQDLTLAEAEQYYQYKINLPDPNLNPNAWQVGSNYISDVLETAVDGRPVKWYQFKIPIREGESINNIQDIRSIRFMRLVMKGFQTPTILRFARMELVRGEWRRYTQNLQGPAIGEPTPPNSTGFEIAAVNVEENGRRTPINYVVPPGINREIDAASANQRNLNEQSLALRLTNLADGDARAAFRSFNIDARMYGKLKMFIHGETADLDDPIKYGDFSVFVRIGTDFDRNYYEYEIPIEPTQIGSPQTGENIWPEGNNMEIDFDLLQNAKNERNRSGHEVTIPYEVFDGDRRVTIIGNPVLSSIRTIMIGVRNPSKDNNPWTDDIGLPIDVEVWVNELRLSDFDQRGGWAAVARMNAQLADLGTISLAGNVSTPGFGGLESKVSERQQETIIGFDASSNLELGKFLPEQTGIRIPMFMSYSELVSLPRFDPLSPDLELNDVTRGLTSEERRDIRQRSRSYQRRRSINFTNVRKERMNQDRAARIWDIENFNFTFGYSDLNRYDINTEFDNSHQFRVGMGYNYTSRPKQFKPFATSRLFKESKWLKMVGDFNFFLIPKQFSFRTDIDRTYSERRNRNNTEFVFYQQPILFTKTFNWSRMYDLQYDMTENLRFTYNANNLAVIGEPEGRLSKEEDNYDEYQREVWNNIGKFGETTTFTQNVSGNYKLPLDKLPLLDWTTNDITYAGTYQWGRAPFSQDTLGHTIQNSRNIAFNSQLNFLTLYNKVPYFKKVNQKFRTQGRGSRTGTRQVGAGDMENQEREKDPNAPTILDYGAKLLMSIKNLSFRYSINEGTLLPGYDRTTTYIGMTPEFDAPGLPFVLGHQYSDFNYEAARRGWLVDNPFINTQYLETYSEDVNIRLNLDPLPNMRVELTTSRTWSTNEGSFFRFNEDLQDYLEESRFETGSFTTTFIAWGTAFIPDNSNNVSPVFTNNFLEYRRDVSNRLARETGYSVPGSGIDGYADGYGPNSQDVILPAFLAAYGNKNPEEVPLKLEDFTYLDMLKNPNWNITYDGLIKFNFFKKYFRSFTVSHAYRSVFSANNFTTNLNAGLDASGVPLRDASEEANFIPDRQITAFTIAEQFSPLFNIDATWLNSLITKFEISRQRTLSFSTANYQLTENRSNEMVIGLGYRIPNVQVKIGGKSRKSDLNLRADLSIRDTDIIIRRAQEGTNQVTSGQNIISVKTAADYVISERLNVRLFYDHQINQPKISTTFLTSNINAGISLRFTLTQ